jgi:antitoxin component YwqK of YwqJK toxin-antitoxin module
MKKSFILPASMLAIFSLSYMLSQTVYANGTTSENGKMESKTTVIYNSGKVSQAVKNSFHAEFGAQSNIHWNQTKNFDVASFDEEGQSVNAYFTKDGVLEGRTFLKNWTDLPFQAQLNIVQRYKDYDVKSVFVYYGKSLNNLGNYFVTLSKDNRTILVQVNEKGNTTLYEKL